MPNITGLVLITAQEGDREDLDDRIFDASPYDTPLIATVPKEDAKHEKHDWIEDQITGLSDVLTASLDASTTAVAVTDGTKFLANDIIVIEAEGMLVTAVSANNLTVVRGYGDTTAAIHAGFPTAFIIAPAMLEGADAREASTTTKSKAYNHCQIFQDTVSVSSSEIEIVTVGGNEWLYQVHKKTKEHAVKVERSFIHGYRVARVANTTRGSAGGIKQWITSEVLDQANGTLTLQQYETMLRGIYDNGGNPTLAYVSPLGMQTMNFWAEGRIETKSGERQFGLAVGELITCFGKQEIILSRHVGLGNDTTTGDIFAIQADLLAVSTLIPTKLEKLGKTGLSEKGMISTEMTFHRGCEYAHGRVFNISGGA